MRHHRKRSTRADLWEITEHAMVSAARRTGHDPTPVLPMMRRLRDQLGLGHGRFTHDCRTNPKTSECHYHFFLAVVAAALTQ
jgi:hypothetical protein